MCAGRGANEEMELVDVVGGVEYVPTYEDKDGDWMLVGDVPWRSALIRTPSSLFLHPVVIRGYSFNKNKNHMFKFI